MKIIDERRKDLIKFKDLKIGDIFEDCETPYLKTEEIEYITTCRTHGTISRIHNAVNLEDGYLAAFDKCDFVKPLNASLVIK